MTLNMPSLLNTFPTSAAAGEGFESKYVEKTFYEAVGIPPIGGIVAWAKSFPGVPALEIDTLFVECNGQVLNDVSSLLDGQTMPDLNGAIGAQRLLKGGTTSGTTAGAGGAHNHTNVNAAAGGARTEGFGGGAHEHYNYEVVWIIRVK